MKTPDCLHLRTRCAHGAVTKKPRWWLPAVLGGQVCEVCGLTLTRPNVCTRFPGVHRHEGPWSA